jgi:hypothetical protein
VTVDIHFHPFQAFTHTGMRAATAQFAVVFTGCLVEFHPMISTVGTPASGTIAVSRLVGEPSARNHAVIGTKIGHLGNFSRTPVRLLRTVLEYAMRAEQRHDGEYCKEKQTINGLQAHHAAAHGAADHEPSLFRGGRQLMLLTDLPPAAVRMAVASAVANRDKQVTPMQSSRSSSSRDSSSANGTADDCCITYGWAGRPLVWRDVPCATHELIYAAKWNLIDPDLLICGYITRIILQLLL